MGQITLKNVSKSFGSTVVIPGADLEIKDGEFIVFVGPSGCGKSTLLRMIAGLEDTTSGEIVIDGKDVSNVGPAERELAMVFQSYALYPHMTVRKNIAFPMRMAYVSVDELGNLIDAAAMALYLYEFLFINPVFLSVGDGLRVVIVRSI
ncbi:MAG: ABC transporter ATP-binding protein, partial [Planctomycetales bacterium]